MKNHLLTSLASLIPHAGENYQKTVRRESELWGQDKSRQRLSWFDSPLIARYINRCISGSPDKDWLDYIQASYCPEPLPCGLNVGCGHGELERLLIERNIVRTIHGFDLSDAAVSIARRQAQEKGLADRIRYTVADANFLEKSSLEPQYDAIFISMALHHFVHLEHCLDELKKRLKPQGFLFANEYVGPDRFQWTDAQIHAADRILQTLPSELKSNLRNPQDPKNHVSRPSLEFMKKHFAFESVCSERIIPALQQRFDMVEKKEYGGTVLQLLFEAIMGNLQEDENREHAIIVQMAVCCEELLLTLGALPHDHALLICQNR